LTIGEYESKTSFKGISNSIHVIAILQFVRIVLGWPAVIANLQIPVSASLVAIIVAGYLAYENWKAAR